MSMIRKTAFVLMLGLSLAPAADDITPPAQAAAAADFSAGFQGLVKLGLPSLEGAEWTSTGEGSDGMEDYELREFLSGLKGKGWKLKVEGKATFLPLGAGGPIESSTSGGGRGGGGILGALFGGGSKKAKATDLTADANKLIATLDDPEKSKDFRENLEYRGVGSLGRLLLFATQLHQSGHTVEANRLANIVFSLGANPEAVIDAAINRLAARDLAKVTEAFFTSKDWAVYERDLQSLAGRYPRGWESFPAVQMLLPAVAKRVAGTMPAPPKIEGVTLNPEAIAALDATLQDTQGAPDEGAVTRYARENGIPASALSPELRQQIAMMLSRGDGESSGGQWLIEEASGEATKDPWTRLKRLGLDALPALAAVANDETLTFSRNVSSSRYSYRSNRESAADLAIAAYQSMDRPLTRGELACRMLASTLPGEGRDETAPQALADSAMEFWKAHRGASRLDLLLVFLETGDSSQKQNASGMLAEMPDEAAQQAFEKHVLESGEITSALDSVSTYLKRRKTAGKDFLNRFSVVLKSQLEGVDLEQISGGYEIKRAGGVDKYLKKLALFVGGESPRMLVLELAKAEKPDVRQIISLAGTVAESSPDQIVPLYLEAAVMATHLETRAAFITALTRHSYGRERGDEQKIKDTPVPSAQIPHWTALLGDERTAADDDQVRHHAAYLLEQFHSPASVEPLSDIYQLDQNAYSDVILARAKDRIAGKPPTPLPTADKVSATRLEEMLKQLADAKPEAVHDLAKSWSIEEKLAFQKWRKDPEHADKLPASVIAARKLMTTPIETKGGPPLAKQMEILESLDLKPGSKFDYSLLTSLAGTAAPAAKEHSGLAAVFTQSPLETGVEVDVVRLFDSPEKDIRSGSRDLSQMQSALEDPAIESVVGIGWISEHRWMQALWKTNDKTVTPPETELLEKLREILDSPEPFDSDRFHFTFSVLHRDDLEKLSKLEQSDDDEDPDASDE